MYAVQLYTARIRTITIIIINYVLLSKVVFLFVVLFHLAILIGDQRPFAWIPHFERHSFSILSSKSKKEWNNVNWSDSLQNAMHSKQRNTSHKFDACIFLINKIYFFFAFIKETLSETISHWVRWIFYKLQIWSDRMQEWSKKNLFS